ncbi:allergen Tha p 1-like isoform X2 [Cylas formicarius]|uniref:allergen Tha p 1-like isoform X2 n=1 Tax=Cylas formicarius TaxID=197179 RepID=UPI0029589136|nr:allergen Tha p 1-like isoform X2 [Cylas formicarius]
MCMRHPQSVPKLYKMRSLTWLSVILCLAIFSTHGNCQRGLSGNVYVEKQLLCALEKGPCDILGRQIKDALPQIIGKNCQSCDKKQLANAKRVARFVQSKYPDVWNDLVKKYGTASTQN